MLRPERRAARRIWLSASIVVLVLAVVLAVFAGVPRWAAVRVAAPVVLGAVPLLLAPANSIPFARAGPSSLRCLVGLIAVLISVFRRTGPTR